jgi:glycosyltransferase involved in cell wall biosynthesis
VYLVNSLVEAGFSVDVLTIKPALGYASLDHSLLHRLPSSVAIYRVFPGPLHMMRHNAVSARAFSPAKEVASLRWDQRALRKARQVSRQTLSALLVPDTMVEWVPWALRKGWALLAQHKVDVLVSSAHPVCDHLIGYLLKRRAQAPWICYYSDPWSFYACREISRLRQALEERLEARLLRDANHIIVPTEEAKEGFLRTFPFLTAEHISLVPAGADLAACPASALQLKPADRFRLVYTGTFYDRVREPFAFYAALQQVEDLDLEVVIAGHVLAQHRDSFSRSRVTYLDYQQRSQCLALQKSADVLLFFGNVSASQLPSKLFEYFAAARPILSIDPLPHTRASQLIQTYRRGVCVPDEPEEIAKAIRELYIAWKEGRLRQAFDVSSLPQFSWEASGRALVRTVEAMLT